MTTDAKSQFTPAALPIAYPLDDFYAQQGLALPRIEAVMGDTVPELYRALLVHQDDMTPTLENFHGAKLHLQVLRSQQRGDFYFREVVLVLDGTNRPVEFGAIKMNLALFSSAARKLILEEREPLGHILRDCAVAHASRPKAYLRVESDDFINRALNITGTHTLYGRRNTHFDTQQRALAEIVEILPPEKVKEASAL
jgi:chorismate-pyruvate lyase